MSSESEMKWFCLGVGLGFGVGFLFAPKSGVEIRKLIQSKTLESSDYLRNQAVNAAYAAADALKPDNKTIRPRNESVVSVGAGSVAYE